MAAKSTPPPADTPPFPSREDLALAVSALIVRAGDYAKCHDPALLAEGVALDEAAARIHLNLATLAAAQAHKETLAKIQRRCEDPETCPHDLSERDTMVADGYCPACLVAELAQVRAAAQGTARQLEEAKAVIQRFQHGTLLGEHGRTQDDTITHLREQLIRTDAECPGTTEDLQKAEAAYAALREATQALVTAVQNWDAHATNCRVKDCLRCQTNHFEMIAAASRVVQP